MLWWIELFSWLAPVQLVERVLTPAGASLVQEEQSDLLQEGNGFIDGLSGEASLLGDLGGIERKEPLLIGNGVQIQKDPAWALPALDSEHVGESKGSRGGGLDFWTIIPYTGFQGYDKPASYETLRCELRVLNFIWFYFTTYSCWSSIHLPIGALRILAL
uniref:Uncharacterized protein n=1 Tax=uncultured prokaryote TaxID=198431 RepID=H5S966_9ZZZZ|nr:hypothetical protein HGMM_F03A04C25 [uncultured prokaryote]